MVRIDITKTMIGPSSQISKALLASLILVMAWYLFMDFNLYMRVQNYPIDRGSVYDNYSISYKEVSWLGCDISPLCDVTVKALLLDHTNHYLFSPLATIVDNIFKIDDVTWITPNLISFFHVFVAILSAKCISNSSLAYRRVGVILFQVRTFLDDMDGHVARARKHIKGEHSEIGSSGYYVDGICDGLGCIALMIGAFVFLINNPPRRGYMQLPTIASSDKDRESSIIYKAKVTTRKVARKICCFSVQLLISSTAWNRYIALYQDMLERSDVDLPTYNRQSIVLKSSFFFCIAWMWRIINVHNMIHCLLLSIFCDKLWEFLRLIIYAGFGILLTAICITEIHLLDVKNFIYTKLTAY